MAIRGAHVDGETIPKGLVGVEELVLAWTLRGAPHAYRRDDLDAVVVATAPYDEADAAKRIFDASKPLKDSGIAVLDSLRTIAAAQRSIVTSPMTKGELSSKLSEMLDPPMLRRCVPCDATHAYEQPFRLAALQGGLEIEPATTPAVVRRIPGLQASAYRHLAAELERECGDTAARFDVIRNYLRFFGPATHQEASAFIDIPVAVVKRCWPADAVQVGEKRFLLADDVDRLGEGPSGEQALRLLGPFDPYLQGRDREGLVADADRRKELWRILGRPGAIVVDGAVLGTWRPKASGKKLTVVVDQWKRPTKAIRDQIEEQALRLAALRGVELAGISDAAKS
ncbi:MAG: winged helix DNA-binding domain-containing protein [Actinobacteria bacterium]|nr:winged helix DNA-binding domain-containing protein [Actinomycetota bacterium]